MADIFEHLQAVEFVLTDEFYFDEVVEKIRDRLKADGIEGTPDDTIIYGILKFVWHWADRNNLDGTALLQACADDMARKRKESDGGGPTD